MADEKNVLFQDGRRINIPGHRRAGASVEIKLY